jgi:sensor domain DACNV-containing protein
VTIVMTEPGYPAARIVAPKIAAYFTHHVADARRRGSNAVDPPSLATLEALIDAAFWASLRREENYAPKISLAIVSPDAAVSPLRFDRPLSLDPGSLIKVAPAVERAGIHLGVWPFDPYRESTLSVWGTTREIPPMAVVVEVAAAGLIVVKHHRGDDSAGKYVNVVVLEGDRIKIVDERASSLPDCPPLLTSLLGFDSPASWVIGMDSVNVLVQLAVSMRAHARGGLLLVVPAGSERWLESIVRPIPYAVVPPFDELARLTGESRDGNRTRQWQETVNRAVEAVAGLTAVDGATVITTDHDLLAFGAKIARRKGSPQVDQVTVTEPIEGDVAQILNPSQLGGTRHLSAAQFVHDQHDCVALVASQDGRFTVFAWSPCEDMVHAHRVEALLL